MNDKIGIYDGATGEQIIREMTDEEQSAYDAHRAIVEKQRADEKGKVDALRQTKIAAYEKLGLSAEEIEALLPTPKAKILSSNG